MPSETEKKVRQLLQPTHDVEWWHEQIRSLRPEEAVPLLGSAMNSDSETEQARHQAATILGILRQKASVAALLQAMQSPGPVLRALAAQALGQIGDLSDESVSVLIKSVDDQDYFVRKCAATALGRLKRPDALVALERMYHSDSEVGNREAAQEAIKAIQGEQ
jgi:HEAT repeat protein